MMKIVDYLTLDVQLIKTLGIKNAIIRNLTAVLLLPWINLQIKNENVINRKKNSKTL